MVFNEKKLLNDGVDLTHGEGAEKSIPAEQEEDIVDLDH
jgi:hypothetical protein